MAVTGPHIEASRFADPCRVADVILATAAVYIEPMAMAAAAYVIGFPPALETP